jgi:uncharacterized protein YejL (UPF0352 family)
MSYENWSDKHDAAKALVAEMLSGLEKQNDSPDYSLGYLESMLTGWASKNEIVFNEISSTVDYLNSEAQNA